MPLDWKPQEEFQKGPLAKQWAEIAGSELFKQAMSAAYAQTTFDFPRTTDMGTASANEFRRQGASMALLCLMNLHSPIPAKKSRDISDQNLDHRI